MDCIKTGETKDTEKKPLFFKKKSLFFYALNDFYTQKSGNVKHYEVCPCKEIRKFRELSETCCF